MMNMMNVEKEKALRATFTLQLFGQQCVEHCQEVAGLVVDQHLVHRARHLQGSSSRDPERKENSNERHFVNNPIQR